MGAPLKVTLRKSKERLTKLRQLCWINQELDEADLNQN